MTNKHLTKQIVESAPEGPHYIVFDDVVPGFGLRNYLSGKKSWVFQYRPGEGGRRAPLRRFVIGDAGTLSPAAARKEALRLRALVATGADPQRDLVNKRQAVSVRELAGAFLEQHVGPKRAQSTCRYYADLLERLVLPTLGKLKAKDVTSSDLARLHHSLRNRPFLANRVLAIVGAMYAFGQGAAGLVPRGTNPSKGIEKFDEPKRERLLSTDELSRLGAALRRAETTGIAWTSRSGAWGKHSPQHTADRTTTISPAAAAAVRLLIFTGARLREILALTWDQVDLDRGLILLAKHKTSRVSGTKAIILNSGALSVLRSIERVGSYVIAGETAGLPNERPRSDLKRPWAMITQAAALDGLRIHDLRHNFAAFGVGGGMGLPIRSSASCLVTPSPRRQPATLILMPTP